jgi:hypothetical protein
VVLISVGLAFPSGKPVSQFVFLPVSNVSGFGSLGLGVDLPSFMLYKLDMIKYPVANCRLPTTPLTRAAAGLEFYTMGE